MKVGNDKDGERPWISSSRPFFINKNTSSVTLYHISLRLDGSHFRPFFARSEFVKCRESRPLSTIYFSCDCYATIPPPAWSPALVSLSILVFWVSYCQLLGLRRHGLYRSLFSNLFVLVRCVSRGAEVAGELFLEFGTFGKALTGLCSFDLIRETCLKGRSFSVQILWRGHEHRCQQFKLIMESLP